MTDFPDSTVVTALVTGGGILILLFLYVRHESTHVGTSIDVNVNVTVVPFKHDGEKRRTKYVCVACGGSITDGPVTLYPLIYGTAPEKALCVRGKYYVACMEEKCPSFYLDRQGFMKDGTFVLCPSAGPLTLTLYSQREVASEIDLHDNN